MAELHIKTAQEYVDVMSDTTIVGTGSDKLTICIDDDLDFKDIDFSDSAINAFTNIKNYTNVDGQNHTIKNLTINRPTLNSTIRIVPCGTSGCEFVRNLKFSNNYIVNGGIAIIVLSGTSGSGINNIIIDSTNTIMSLNNNTYFISASGSRSTVFNCLVSGNVMSYNRCFAIYCSANTNMYNCGVILNITYIYNKSVVVDVGTPNYIGNCFFRGKVTLPTTNGNIDVYTLGNTDTPRGYYVYTAFEYDIPEDSIKYYTIHPMNASTFNDDNHFRLYDKTLLEKYNVNANDNLLGVTTEELKSESFLRDTCKWPI